MPLQGGTQTLTLNTTTCTYHAPPLGRVPTIVDSNTNHPSRGLGTTAWYRVVKWQTTNSPVTTSQQYVSGSGTGLSLTSSDLDVDQDTVIMDVDGVRLYGEFLSVGLSIDYISRGALMVGDAPGTDSQTIVKGFNSTMLTHYANGQAYHGWAGDPDRYTIPAGWVTNDQNTLDNHAFAGKCKLLEVALLGLYPNDGLDSTNFSVEPENGVWTLEFYNPILSGQRAIIGTAHCHDSGSWGSDVHQVHDGNFPFTNVGLDNFSEFQASTSMVNWSYIAKSAGPPGGSFGAWTNLPDQIGTELCVLNEVYFTNYDDAYYTLHAEMDVRIMPDDGELNFRPVSTSNNDTTNRFFGMTPPIWWSTIPADIGMLPENNWLLMTTYQELSLTLGEDTYVVYYVPQDGSLVCSPGENQMIAFNDHEVKGAAFIMPLLQNETRVGGFTVANSANQDYSRARITGTGYANLGKIRVVAETGTQKKVKICIPDSPASSKYTTSMLSVLPTGDTRLRSTVYLGSYHTTWPTTGVVNRGIDS